jgi:hypothetical protein
VSVGEKAPPLGEAVLNACCFIRLGVIGHSQVEANYSVTVDSACKFFEEVIQVCGNASLKNLI